MKLAHESDILRSRVGVDGVLRLAIPVGSAEAEHQMHAPYLLLKRQRSELREFVEAFS